MSIIEIIAQPLVHGGDICDESIAILNIVTDRYAHETSWKLLSDTGEQFLKGTQIIRRWSKRCALSKVIIRLKLVIHMVMGSVVGRRYSFSVDKNHFLRG